MDHIIDGNSFLSQPDTWRYRRMNALTGQVTLTAPEAVLPSDFHLTLVDSARPDRWNFAAPPSPERDPRHPEFTRVRSNSRVLPDEAAVDEALDAVAREYASLRFEGTPLRRSEEASWKKFTIQHGTTSSWYLAPIGPGVKPTSFPARFIEIARHVARVYAVVVGGSVEESNPDPATTNGGYPTFVTHKLAKIAGGILLGSSFADTLECAQRVGRNLGLPEAAALGNGLGGRSGPLYKEQPLYRFTGNGWETIGTWKGHAQRNRIVHMSCAAVNRGLRRIFDRWHTARMRLPGMWHAGVRDVEHMRGAPYLFESDISGFDTSVLRQLQTLVATVFAEVWPDMAADLEFWLAAESLPMIGPSWTRGLGTCAIVSGVGGTRSGLKPTAEAGCLYSLLACLWSLDCQGFNALEWPYITGAKTLIQGDDVLGSTVRQLDPDQWTASYADAGLKATVVDGDLFLSRHMSFSGLAVPVGGRIVQQTLSGEHEPRGDAAEVDGLLILGFISRTEGVEWLPEDIRFAIGRCVRVARWIREYVPREVGDDVYAIRCYLRDEPHSQAAIRTSIELAKSESWIMAEYRDAAHSATSRYLIDYLLKKYPDLLQNPLSEDRTVDAITRALLRRPMIDRVALATTYGQALFSSKKQSDQLFNELVVAYGERT